MMRGVTKRAVSILERPVYGVAEAASVLGLQSDRTRAWLDGYQRRDVRYDPVIRPEPNGDDVVTVRAWWMSEAVDVDVVMVKGMTSQRVEVVEVGRDD